MFSIAPLVRGTLDPLPSWRPTVDTWKLMRGTQAPFPVRIVLLQGSNLVLQGEVDDPSPQKTRELSSAHLASLDPTAHETHHYIEGAQAAGAQAFFLGKTPEGSLHVALSLPHDHHLPSGCHAVSMRWCGHALSDDDTVIALTATALAAWHESTRYCARCGQQLHPVLGGWATLCSGCGHYEYPRQDPAVIMAVLDDNDRLLLAHNTERPEGYVSVLAGFVEAGEAPEQTVVREVREEVSLDVGDVKPVGTQPWPFPRSLMLAYTARLLPEHSPTPHPDGEEIDSAAFYSRHNLREAIRSGKISLPGRSTIAHGLITQWYGGELPANEHR